MTTGQAVAQSIAMLAPEVADSEFALLSIARAVVDQAPERDLAAIGAYLHQAREVPARRDGVLSPVAVDLLERTLSTGLVLTLMRRGGWRVARCVHGESVRTGRLWERHEPPMLEVTRFGVDLLLWLTAAPLRRADCEPMLTPPQTVGDQLLAYAALDLARRAGCQATAAQQPAFRLSPLCWLGFADVLSEPAEPPRDLEFTALLREPAGGGGGRVESGHIVLEALQHDLARRWVEMEQAKYHVRDTDRMRRLGASQELVLGRLFAAIDHTGDTGVPAGRGVERRQLAGFAIEAAAEVVAGRPGVERWVSGLDERRGRGVGASIAARAESRRMAGAFLRALATIARWRDEAASVRFFDDDYQAAQQQLLSWEPLGDAGFAHAQAIASQLESLDAVVHRGDST